MTHIFTTFASHLSDRQLLRLARTAYERGCHRVYQALAFERFRRRNMFNQ